MKHKSLYIMAMMLPLATGAWAQSTDPAPIDLTPSADGKVWTLSTMPAYDIELQVAYKSDLTLTVNIEGWTFGGTTSTPALSGNESGGAVTYE